MNERLYQYIINFLETHKNLVYLRRNGGKATALHRVMIIKHCPLSGEFICSDFKDGRKEQGDSTTSCISCKNFHGKICDDRISDWHNLLFITRFEGVL